MSIGKRMLFDSTPEFVQQQREEARAAIDAHPHRIPTRRKNKVAHSPRWDPLWPAAISSAAKELSVRCIQVNVGMCFEQEVDRDRVRVRAEELWQEWHDYYASLLRK